ncbi:glyoxylate/hydroxypyruvate reductase A [Aliiroseovarius sp. KMU-50]|uniref:Glyoxylate/hydroxypyruvate reductase A n=1 Tax=Aliiroseovarius salicola TaxID=3009082 RepID=A0ABT4VZ13_9RHOB|nr:glyoxylate/hydroxypyruvate reductase A [Aliiroseovarius sp. KMU-50]MDA5093492.1 glyoxylate/hydroxypyruvate reductase A [Aliiroseovarius sp. KMU-50]
MTVNVLFAGRDAQWPIYEPTLRTAFANAGVVADLRMEFAPGEVDYIVYAPSGKLSDLTPYTRCKAVLGLWAGVEQIITNPTLTQPYTRMVDQGLTEGMVEWVAGHVLRYHLDMDMDICRTDREWQVHIPPLARNRTVGVLGLGELGSVCAQALAGLNFNVQGWSRSAKSIAGVACHFGEVGLRDVLAQAEILVLLLPKTAATENVLNADTVALLPKGSRILNPGRGPLIDDEALLTALGTGQVGHATLDVFREEPLPRNHPYWAHPNVTVTPHIASETRPDTASEVIAENIRRSEAGEPLLHLVDKARGY